MTTPERIWAMPVTDDAKAGAYCDAGNMPLAPSPTAFCYRRADLPPTLAQALELPEIAALVDALKPLAIADKKQRAHVTDGTMPITPPNHGGFLNLTRVAEALAKLTP